MNNGTTDFANATDIQNVKKDYSVSLSCTAVAAIINKLLVDKAYCFKVICDPTPSNDYDIPAGVKFDSVFK